MREIGTIADGDAAGRLADYLLTLDITTKLDPKPSGTVVWVHREERVEQARRELEAFLLAPDDPKYLGVQQTAKALRREAERAERLHARNSISLSGRWNHRPAGRCPLTILLIVASAAVALVSHLGERDEPILPLYLPTVREVPQKIDDAGHPVTRYQFQGLSGLRRGEVWRLITPIFIHFGALHLIYNMIWLYDLGGLIEMRRGSVRLLAIVLISGSLSNLSQYFWTPDHFSGGMSGVVYALFGYVWMVGRFDPSGGMAVTQQTIQWMMIWLFLCMSGVLGPIGNAAHVAGLGVGLVLGFAPQAPRVLRRWL